MLNKTSPFNLKQKEEENTLQEVLGFLKLNRKSHIGQPSCPLTFPQLPTSLNQPGKILFGKQEGEVCEQRGESSHGIGQQPGPSK